MSPCLRRTAARPVGSDVFGEYPQRAAHQPGDAVRVFAHTPPVDEVGVAGEFGSVARVGRAEGILRRPR